MSIPWPGMIRGLKIVANYAAIIGSGTELSLCLSCNFFVKKTMKWKKLSYLILKIH